MSSAADHRRTTNALAVLGALAAVAFAIAFYRVTDWTAPFPRDATGLAVGRDFLNFWMTGHAARAPDPGRYYDVQAYNDALASMVGRYPGQTWSYPPTQLLIAWPFAFLSYRLALLLWLAGGAAILYVTLRRTIGGAALVFAAPAALFAVMSGQSSFLTTALLIGGLSLLDRRPVLAGVLLGLLSLKPQTAVLVPVALIAGRHWRSLASAAGTALALIAATAAFYGIAVWRDYFAIGLPAQNAILVHTEILATESMPTIFMNLHRAGLSYGVSMAVQALFAAAAAFAVFKVWRRAAAPVIKVSVLLAASVAATPYLMAYDALPLAAAGLWLLNAGVTGPRGTIIVKLAWWLPFVQLAFGHFGIPGPALIAPALVLWAFRRATTSAVAGCPSQPV